MNASSRNEWKRWLDADLCELARGRVRPHRHWRQILFEADLSPAALERIATVVRRSRLWRLEKSDVAEELVSHFAEGREAGRTDAELLQSFGDSLQAARLIRSAKKLQRPVLYRAFVATLKAVGSIAAVYAVLVLWANASRPQVTVDYRAKLDALVGTEPGEDTAWPYYRKALIAMDVDNYNHPDHDLLYARPGDTNWSAAMAWRDRHVEAIEWIRQGGQRPNLGFSAGRLDELSPEDWRALFPEQDDPNPSPREDPSEEWKDGLSRELLFFAGKAKTLGYVLALDIRAQVSRGETAGLVENYTAGVSLAEGVLERPFWIHGSVSLAILHTLENTVVEAMESTGFALERSELAALRREASSADSVFRALERVLEVERWMVLDMIQRTYSTDFLGSGRLTRVGALLPQKSRTP